MPEGPEVKIASNYFNSFFNESKIIKFTIITDYYKKKYNEVFKTVNTNINNYPKTYTIGKNIFINLNNQLVFNFHLGMTGGWSQKKIKHCHFIVSDNRKSLFFQDVRKFGNMRIFKEEQIEQLYNKKIDILNPNYDPKYHIKYLEEKIKGDNKICKIMMNQKLFPGVGNYIKSESLFAAKIHPEEKWKNLSFRKKTKLIKKTTEIMTKSLECGGAELKDFKNPFHISNFNLNIYGKNLTPQKKPVTSILTSDNRKSWFCSDSQKLMS